MNAVRTIFASVMAAGYASTMALGPRVPEPLSVFGIAPSQLAVQVLFFLSGYLAMRSLRRDGSAAGLLLRRARRNLLPLAAVSLVVAFLIYPIIAQDTVAGTLGIRERLFYVVLTVSCIDPGNTLPGALDRAHYACLLQGAIWTFRWGALAYLFTALLWQIGTLARAGAVTRLMFAAMLAYATVHFVSEKAGLSELAPVIAGLRLAYPFAMGLAVCIWVERHSDLVRAPAVWMGLALGALAGANFAWLFWTPLIEIAAVGALSAAALAVAYGQGRLGIWLEDWPALALPVFILNWPVAQLWLYVGPGLSSGQLVALTLTSVLGLALVFGRGRVQPKSALSPPLLSQLKRPRTA